jgi:hypothetical protein
MNEPLSGSHSGHLRPSCGVGMGPTQKGVFLLRGCCCCLPPSTTGASPMLELRAAKQEVLQCMNTVYTVRLRAQAQSVPPQLQPIAAVQGAVLCALVAMTNRLPSSRASPDIWSHT